MRLPGQTAGHDIRHCRPTFHRGNLLAWRATVQVLMKKVFCMKQYFSWLLLLLPLWAVYAVADETAAPDTDTDHGRQYTFSWMFLPGDSMRPRGGTTPGMPVKLADRPTNDWLALAEPGLSPRERDRRAILAMAGGYRTSFDFIETAGFTEGYTAKPPYQSWATEHVYVVADEPSFISLQHVLVMTIQEEDAKPSVPMVVKHWRQDWRYENTELFAYRGNNTWERVVLPKSAVKGRWSQSVYQVDDSPRYAAIGQWQHASGFSSWTSEETWRPLPRREFSVRDDYQVLVGTNRHTLTPTGWIHMEDNRKVVLNDDGSQSVLATEVGLNRYERILGYDWTPGDAYWERTNPFWRQVRIAWDTLFVDRERITLQKQADGTLLFMRMFDLAERSADGEVENNQDTVVQALSPFIAGSNR